MRKVSSIDHRKSEHIRINLEQDIHSGLTSGLERIRLIHEALPEINLEAVDTTETFFGKSLKVPLLISSMTGGTSKAMLLNRRFAEAASELGIGMGVGSQRAAFENNAVSDTFTITRKIAKDILLFANLGAIQLNNGYGLDECRRAVDMIEADALILHLNPLQEALQPEGNTNFSGLAKKVEEICSKVAVPVVIKEVGWGISTRTAKILVACGASAIDVAGAGGTSWSQVEMHRSRNISDQLLSATFRDWGITTVESIRNVKASAPDLPIIASGGLKDGLDIAKSIALGSTLAGMAGPLLKAAAVSTEQLIGTIQLFTMQLKLAMFASGVLTLSKLRSVQISKSP